MSDFKGGLLDYVLRIIVGSLLTIVTFGIMYPWSLCLVYKWQINNTYIDGHKLEFNGTATGLFGNWIKWWFFTLITFGIYGFWVFIKLRQWKIRHTTMVS